MPKVKSGNWKHVTVLSESEQKLQCVYCSKVYSGGVLRIRSHLLGNNSMKKCKSVPSDVISSLTGEIKMKTEAKLLWQTKQSLHEATTSGASTSTSSGIPIPGSSAVDVLKQASIPQAFQASSIQAADSALARLFYASGIPFVVAESQYFKDALSAVIKCGAGYKPPSRFDIAGRLLSAEVSSVDSKLAEFKKQVAITGGTLTSDGWSNIQNRPVINCLLVTGDGAMFIDAVDTSGEVKDAAFIADELARNINSVGLDNIVQVVTDSASNCVGARKILQERFGGIVFAPCTAHCLDLLLEDIGKLTWTSHVIAEARAVVKFITNHHKSLAIYREHSHLELLKPGETRFASQFIMLQRINNCKDALQETVVDREYKKWLSCGKSAVMGKTVTDTVLSENFWQSVAEIVELSEPIVSLLRLVDGVVPCVGKIYWKMYEIDVGMMNSSLTELKKNALRTIVNNRWKMLHSDLHAAGFVLDPVSE